MRSRLLPVVASLVALLCALLGAALAISPATADAPAPKCAGFKIQTGVTKKIVWLGNASDVSGPVPGAGTSAQLAAKAYVAYFNANGKTICGRKLGLKTYDSKTDAAGDLAAYKAMCSQVFGAVGSTSIFDNGGATTAQGCGLPDVRVNAQSSARIVCNTCFGVDATWSGEVPNSIPDYFLATHHAATQRAGLLYLNLPTTKARALATQKVDQQRGYTHVYSSAYDLAEFNYGPYVQQLKSHGAQLVEIVGTADQAYRFRQAMDVADYHPEVFFAGDVAYTGTAAEGTLTAINHLPLTATSNTELNRYRKWLAQVSPGAKPTPEGLYAWSATRLFVEQAVALGGRMLRPTLVAKLRTVRNWTAGGIHVPQLVGTEHASPCVRFLSMHGGKWISVGGTAYRCSGVTRAS